MTHHLKVVGFPLSLQNVPVSAKRLFVPYTDKIGIIPISIVKNMMLEMSRTLYGLLAKHKTVTTIILRTTTNAK